MDLEFERADLLQIDPISCRGTVKLLPLGKKKKQKICTGDDTGTLGCYEFKKGEPVVCFSGCFFDGPVSAVTVGGIHTKKDKIFASHGQRVLGFTKKGKEFFKLTSSLTEPINHLQVEDTKIWTACEYIYSVYENGADVGFYMCHDQIHSMQMEYIVRQTDYDAVLGCQDNCVRIISGSDLAIEIATPAPVTAICSMHGDESKMYRGSASLLYGCDTGQFSNVLVDGNENRCLWSVQDDRKTSITCMKAFDVTQDGNQEIIVARDDGRLEIFTQSSISPHPVKSFARDLGESIRSIEAGKVNSSTFNEVVVAGYSGRITSFTSEPTHQRAPDDTYGRSVQTVNNENRIKHLKKEIDVLKGKVDKEKSKYRLAQQKFSQSTQDHSRAAFIDFPINSKFTLNTDEAAYCLTVEIQSPIDLVVLRSPVQLDLIDTDVGSAVVSVTPQTLISPSQDGGQDYRFVATYRCQSQERRLNVFIRTTEGEFGDLLVTVVSATEPKSAKIIRYPMKPLSLQTRVHTLTEEEMRRPRNVIQFTGSVSLSILHEWITTIFPEVPSRIDESSTGENYFFRNVFTGAVAIVRIKKNGLVIECENVSTIAIVKENVLRLATARRFQLDDQSTTNPDSVFSFLSLIRARLEHQLSLSRKMTLIEAIQEITMQESDLRWLSPEYAEILRDEDKIRKEYSQRTKSLERLTGLITDLFVDWHKMRGRDVRSGIPTLQNLITTGSFEDMVQMILKF